MEENLHLQMYSPGRETNLPQQQFVSEPSVTDLDHSGAQVSVAERSITVH